MRLRILPLQGRIFTSRLRNLDRSINWTGGLSKVVLGVDARLGESFSNYFRIFCYLQNPFEKWNFMSGLDSPAHFVCFNLSSTLILKVTPTLVSLLTFTLLNASKFLRKNVESTQERFTLYMQNVYDISTKG